MNHPILDSKSKQKVLMTMIQQPGRYFSVKELSLRTGMGQGKIKAVLASFLRNQVLRMAEKARIRFYQIDRHSSFYEELNKIFGSEKRKKDKRADLIEKIVLSGGNIKLAVLSGIFVGLPRAQVDLLLVGRVGAKRLEKILRELEKITGCEINYSIMDEAEYLNRLYSFDWFVKEIMEKEPVVLTDKLSKTRGKNQASSQIFALTSGRSGQIEEEKNKSII